MNEKILVISNQTKDADLFQSILESKGFDIVTKPVFEDIKDIISDSDFGAIIADYDQVEDLACDWINLLQENRSQSCVILYGDSKQAEKISEVFQAGAYSFISRSNIASRLHDSIMGGMENRKAFIEILGMINTLKNLNNSIEEEKEALKKKNQKLSFINRLTTEVAYDLNWSLILPKILNAGFLNIFNPAQVGILYRIGAKWNMTFHLPEKEINNNNIDKLKEDMCNKFFSISGERIPIQDMDFHLYSSGVKMSSANANSSSRQIIKPLSLAGSVLGMLAILPKNSEKLNEGKMELLTTISNILAMSLKNAQEYHRLKELSVKDGLTGILNRKGFQNFIQKEFHRAKRYRRPLSLIMIDIDNFKMINDSFGHQAGDFVLRKVAGCLRSSIRQADIVFRYGGDEFVILLPDTDVEQSKMLLKRVLSDVENNAFKWKSNKIKVKISCGISTTSELENHENEKHLISKADTRLYSVKQSQEPKYCIALT